MQITFHGAAQTTTGSMHLLEFDGARILLECGMYQGRRKLAFERNRNLPFDPSSIDKVILSHAHMDHSGNLPSLVKHGFAGEIIATPATRDLCDIMLRDSAHIQEKDVEYVNLKRVRQHKVPFEPLYVAADIDPTMARFRPEPYERQFEVVPGVTGAFHDAGHLLGSASVTLDFMEDGEEKRLLFTGDMGRNGMPILRDPVVVNDVDYLITESTYGSRLHSPKADVIGKLKSFVDDIVAQNGKLVIPSFSVGRTQQIVLFLHELHSEGRIPDLPVFVDSPLSTKATGVYANHRECFDREATEFLLEGKKPFQFRSLTYVTETEASKALNRLTGPAIIISSSGMCEGGRIVHHLRNNIGDARNIVLFIGYQAQHTLGRRIVQGVNPIKIFGDEYTVRARIEVIDALSAHADRDEMLAYFREMGPEVEKAFVVHGEPIEAAALAAELHSIGARHVVIPELGQVELL